MPHYEVETLHSPQCLRQQADRWDDLWARSQITLPTVRAEHVALWLEQFAPQAEFRALVLRDGERFVAALPLVSTRLARLFAAGDLTSNAWAPSGDLLLDEAGDVDAALDQLVSALRKLAWPLLWFNGVLLETSRWQAMLRAMKRADFEVEMKERFRVGKLECRSDWESFRKSWSSNLRKAMNKGMRRLEEAGYRFVTIRPDADEVEPLLREALAIEHRSWKGEDGGSVLAAGMLDFYLRQAQELASRHEVQFSFLEIAGEQAAFEYAYVAKGVYHPFKIGYDPNAAPFGPGQLLRHEVLHELCDDVQLHAVDFVGPIGDAVARWKPPTYGVARLVVSPQRNVGRAVMFAWQHVWPNLKRLRSMLRRSEMPATPETSSLSDGEQLKVENSRE